MNRQYYNPFGSFGNSGPSQADFDMLNLKKGASDKEIETAYRRQRVKYNPGRYQDPQKKKEIVEKLKKIEGAYKRIKGGGQSSQGHQGQRENYSFNFGDFGFGNSGGFSRSNNGGFFNMNDIFSDLFTQGRGNTRNMEIMIPRILVQDGIVIKLKEGEIKLNAQSDGGAFRYKGQMYQVRFI